MDSRSGGAARLFFAPSGSYTDVAFGATYEGHAGIAKFHTYMLKFASDSVIEFDQVLAHNGHLHSKWIWTGTYDGPLRLRSGHVVDAAGKSFSVPGVAICEYDENGKLTSHEDYWDLATVLDQVGVTIESAK